MMKHNPRVALLTLVAAQTLGASRGWGAPSSPTGELVIAWHVTIPPPGSTQPKHPRRLAPLSSTMPCTTRWSVPCRGKS